MSGVSGKPLKGETESLGALVYLKINKGEEQVETGKLGKVVIAKV